jgi:hypothetical protein
VPVDLISALGTTQRQAIIRARRNLVSTILGYSKKGGELFKELALTPPAKKTQERAVA